MKKISSRLSLLLAALLLSSAFASCSGRENDTENKYSESSHLEMTSTFSSETEETESTSQSASESETKENTPLLEDKDAPQIECAYSLANKVNAYYTDDKRTGFVTENSNMKLTYSTDMTAERKVTALTDKKGNAYLSDTMDIFVKMKGGEIYYASKTANSTKVSQFAGLNIFRFGYYYYDVRFEDQNFVNEINILSETTLDISKIASKEGVDTKYSNSFIFSKMTDQKEKKKKENSATNSWEYRIKYCHFKINN